MKKKKVASDTQHMNFRQFRLNFAEQVLGFRQSSNPIYMGFMWNKDRPWLPEVHVVHMSGIIEIYNPQKGKRVTLKIARPEQIRAVYRLPIYVGWNKSTDQPVVKNPSGTPPVSLLKKCAYFHNRGWNDDSHLPPVKDWNYWKEELKKRNQ